MTVWTCRRCSTTFQVGLVDMCPGCSGTDVVGEASALTSVRGGVILPGYAPPIVGVAVESETAGAGDAVNAETGEVTPAGQPLPEIPDDGTGTPLDPPEEEPCPGSSSSTSPAKPPKSAVPATGSHRKRARGTGSRSSKAQAGSSSARSTGTSGRGTGG